MDYVEKLRKIMAEEFDIHTDEELIKACENLDVSDLSIFSPKAKEQIGG